MVHNDLPQELWIVQMIVTNHLNIQMGDTPKYKKSFIVAKIVNLKTCGVAVSLRHTQKITEPDPLARTREQSPWQS
jgi:hypothetical protein